MTLDVANGSSTSMHDVGRRFCKGCAHGCALSTCILLLHHVMQGVVLRLADIDEKGMVTRSEMGQLHFVAEEYAKMKNTKIPNSLDTLINALFLGFDRKRLRELLELQASAGAELREVEAVLKVG